MSISALMSADLVIVEPGTTTPLGVEITNRGTETDQVEIRIEGLDPEWTAVPVPVLNLDSNETGHAKVFFKPSRASESLAGNYPFVIRFRSLVTGEERTGQGVLQVQPYQNLSLEVSPRKGFISAAKRMNTFSVTVVNLGNTEHTVHLNAGDPENECTYEWSAEKVQVGPGQQREVEVTVTPNRRSSFGQSRLVGFSATGRSVEVPSASCGGQAQLEIRPLLSPGSLVAAIALFILLLVLWITAPKPARMVKLMAIGGTKVYVGSPVTITWAAENALNVEVKAGSDNIGEELETEGSTVITPKLAGTLVVTAFAIRKDGSKGEARELILTVETPPIVPDPSISKLEVDPKEVPLGSQFTLTYAFGPEVVKATLSPFQTELDLNTDKYLVPAPTKVGLNEYEIIATNKAGKIVRKKFSVQVFEPILAKIIAFSVEPETVTEEGSSVTVKWQATSAARVELSYTGGKTQELAAEGMVVVPITGKTNFTIKVFDQNGKTVTQSKTVEYKPVAPTMDSGTDATTAGTTGDGEDRLRGPGDAGRPGSPNRAR